MSARASAPSFSPFQAGLLETAAAQRVLARVGPTICPESRVDRVEVAKRVTLDVLAARQNPRPRWPA